MSVTVVLAGASEDDLAVHVDPLAELQAFLHGLAHGDHHPRSDEAREVIFGSGSEKFLARMRTFAPLFGTIRARFLLPMDAAGTPIPSLEERLEALRRLPVERFAQFAAESLIEESRIFGNDDPIRRPDVFLHVLSRVAQPRVDLGRDLLDRPDGVRDQLISFFSDTAMGWFDQEWDRRRGLLAQDAAEMRDALRRESLLAIARVSVTAVVAPDPERIVFDKVNRARFSIATHGAILVPTYHGSPHLIAKSDGAGPAVIQYPVLEKQVESRDLVRLRIHALRDDARVEICRTVMRSPKTTADLAAQLQMTEPQVSRHLRVLREAELVSRSQRGRYVYYSLNVSVLRALGEDLLGVLHR